MWLKNDGKWIESVTRTMESCGTLREPNPKPIPKKTQQQQETNGMNERTNEWTTRFGGVSSCSLHAVCGRKKKHTHTHTHTHTHRIAGKLGNKKNRQSLRRNATGGVSQVSRRSPRSARLTNRAGPLVAMRKKTSKINVREKRKKMVMIQFISGTDRPVQRPVVRCFSETTRPTRCSSRFYDINPSETR